MKRINPTPQQQSHYQEATAEYRSGAEKQALQWCFLSTEKGKELDRAQVRGRERKV